MALENATTIIVSLQLKLTAATNKAAMMKNFMLNNFFSNFSLTLEEELADTCRLTSFEGDHNLNNDVAVKLCP